MTDARTYYMCTLANVGGLYSVPYANTCVQPYPALAYLYLRGMTWHMCAVVRNQKRQRSRSRAHAMCETPLTTERTRTHVLYDHIRCADSGGAKCFQQYFSKAAVMLLTSVCSDGESLCFFGTLFRWSQVGSVIAPLRQAV